MQPTTYPVDDFLGGFANRWLRRLRSEGHITDHVVLAGFMSITGEKLLIRPILRERVRLLRHYPNDLTGVRGREDMRQTLAVYLLTILKTAHSVKPTVTV